MTEMKFENLIPLPDRLLDKSGDLADFAGWVDYLLDQHPKADMALMRQQINPWTCDARFLKPLSMSVGIEYMDELATAAKRRMAGNAQNLYKLRGSVYPLKFLAYQMLGYILTVETTNNIAFGISNFSRSRALLPEIPFEELPEADVQDGAQYHFGEGSGTAVDNEQGDAAADMTLSNAGMWESSIRKFGYKFSIGADGGTSGYSGAIAHCANIDFDGESNLTARIWFRASDAGEAGEGRLISKASALEIYLKNTDEIAFVLNTAGGSTEVVTTTSPLDGEWDKWHLLILTYDGTTKTLYLDGKAILNSTAEAGAIVDTAENIMYILDNAANTRAFDGQMGCLAFDHVCMEVEEIKKDWEASAFSETLEEANDLSVRFHDHLAQRRILLVTIDDWDGSEEKVRILEYLIEEWTNARRGRYSILPVTAVKV